jgi:hypothetical protein
MIFFNILPVIKMIPKRQKKSLKTIETIGTVFSYVNLEWIFGPFCFVFFHFQIRTVLEMI